MTSRPGIRSGLSGDRILGYDGRPWPELYRELLAAELPLRAAEFGSSLRAFEHTLSAVGGRQLAPVREIDILKHSSGRGRAIPDVAAGQDTAAAEPVLHRGTGSARRAQAARPTRSVARPGHRGCDRRDADRLHLCANPRSATTGSDQRRSLLLPGRSRSATALDILLRQPYSRSPTASRASAAVRNPWTLTTLFFRNKAA
jgi:hypothetical protein